MCGCDKHHNPDANCTCLCDEHRNFEKALQLALDRYDEIARLQAQVDRVRALADDWKSQGAVSVYESLEELGHIVQDALDGGEG